MSEKSPQLQRFLVTGTMIINDDTIQGIMCLVSLHPVKTLYLSNHKTIIFTSIMRI